MEPITAAALGTVLQKGLEKTAEKVVETGVLDPALAPINSRLQAVVERFYQTDQRELLATMQAALQSIALPADATTGATLLTDNALARLRSEGNHALRQRLAVAVLQPDATPLDDLANALAWPRSHTAELSALLAAIRAQLSTVEPWQPLIEYFDKAAALGLMERLVSQLAAVNVAAAGGEALRVVPDQPAATDETRRAYLTWLRDQYYYLDPRGTIQTQRQVQVKLDEVYISLRAERELGADVYSKLRPHELAVLEAQLADETLSAEAREQLQDEFLWREAQRQTETLGAELMELSAAVTQHPQLVILGDPGAGKTTLLHYLALQHAQAMLDNKDTSDADLGPTRFPIYMRISEYAYDERWRERSLSDELAEMCNRNEMNARGLQDLMAQKLKAGNCLVMLDGLDEIVTADDRIGIVEKIMAFVRHHEGAGNRFIVTSRISGYRNAPLPAPFAHYTVQDMDEAQIERFLSRWTLAVERAQTPDVSEEQQHSAAQLEVDGIMAAVRGAAGVRRMAANPLLLRILALIHKSGARLPQKRVELYDITATTLAEGWRAAQGVAQSALAEKRHVDRILGELAYWMHAHRPTGLATKRDVIDQLGGAWARMKRQAWDMDDPPDDILDEVHKFLTQVRVHTGLFVERAPNRYGFMHLTFEEYYAARHLVARSKSRAKLIRRHLHDPRWEEPILLALGFVGKDYPEDAAELLEAAILAEGALAEAEGFAPSDHEALLGRDYLFALRALGDQIPCDSVLLQRMIARLQNELLYPRGHANYRRYRRTLDERVAQLTGSEAEEPLSQALLSALRDESWHVRARAAASLGQLGAASEGVVSGLVALLGDADWAVRERAAASLVQLGAASEGVVSGLVALLGDADWDVRARAALSIGQLGHHGLELAPILCDTLRSAPWWVVRRDAAQLLGRLDVTDAATLPTLQRSLLDSDDDVRSASASALATLGRRSDAAKAAVEALLLAALEDEAFAPGDRLGRRGHDHAYDSLWQLVVGE